MTIKFRAFLWHTVIFFLFTIWMNTVPNDDKKRELTRTETLRLMDMLREIMDGEAIY